MKSNSCSSSSRSRCGVDLRAVAELDAHAANHLDLAQAVGGAQFVLGNAVGVQAAGQRAALDDRGLNALPAQLRRAGQRRGTGADAGHLHSRDAARVRSSSVSPAGMESVHGVALQAADLDGLLVVAMHHAGAFAEHFHRADARAAAAEDIGIENASAPSRADCPCDSLDEAGHVDVGGTGGGAGRVKTIEAAVGLNDGGLRRERSLSSLKRSRNSGSSGKVAVLIRPRSCIVLLIQVC